MKAAKILVDECAVEGCEKPRAGRYCPMHEARIRRHGDPNAVIHQRDRSLRRGKDHPMWTEVPSYSAVHLRLRKSRGPASAQTCKCGKPAAQWAFVGPVDGALVERGMPYSADLGQYDPMCVSCHKSMDLARIEWVDPPE